MGEYDRAAALYRQRMAQTNTRIAAESPQGQRQTRMDPHMTRIGPPQPGPPPRGAPQSVKDIGWASRKISPANDPANKYKSLSRAEYATASPAADEDMSSHLLLSRVVTGVVIILALASVFVLPKSLKVFWLVILGLTALMQGGFTLYKELMSMSQRDGEENKKYAQWAGMILYAITMIYTAVMVGILFFMAWSLYSIANSQSNIARLDRAVLSEKEEEMVEGREYA